MKKTLLFACTFISFVTISQAQIKKGSILLGGSISLNNSKIETELNESKATGFTVIPTIGLAVKDNWVVGVSAGYSKYKNDPDVSSYGNESEGFSAGVFGRRYLPLGKNFFLYGGADLSLYKQETEQFSGTDYITNSQYKGVNAGVSPGIAYAVNKRFHLEAYLNNLLTFNYSKNETENITLAGRTITKGTNIGFQTNINTSAPFSLGFRFVLGK